MSDPTLDDLMRDDGMMDVRDLDPVDTPDGELRDSDPCDDELLRTRFNRIRGAAKSRARKRALRGAQ